MDTKGSRSYIYDHAAGQHRVSTGKNVHHAASDPQLAHNSFKQLFAEKPQYLRAVCEFILIDYVCLPNYTLPEACAYLQPRVEEGRQLLRDQIDPAVAVSMAAGKVVASQSSSTTGDTCGGSSRHSRSRTNSNSDSSFSSRNRTRNGAAQRVPVPTMMILGETPRPSRHSSVFPLNHLDLTPVQHVRGAATTAAVDTTAESRQRRPSKCYGVYNRQSGGMSLFLKQQVMAVLNLLNETTASTYYEEKGSELAIERFRHVKGGMYLFPKSIYFPAIESDIAYVRLSGAAGSATISNILKSVSSGRGVAGYSSQGAKSGTSSGLNSAARFRTLFTFYEHFPTFKHYEQYYLDRVRKEREKDPTAVIDKVYLSNVCGPWVFTNHFKVFVFIFAIPTCLTVHSFRRKLYFLPFFALYIFICRASIACTNVYRGAGASRSIQVCVRANDIRLVLLHGY